MKKLKLPQRKKLKTLSKEQIRCWKEPTLSLWSPPTILMPRMCSSSSRSSNLSVLVVAGSPDLTFTSLTLPIPKSPFTSHLLTKGLYFWGWSNLLTRDHTWCKKSLINSSISWKPTITKSQKVIILFNYVSVYKSITILSERKV